MSVDKYCVTMGKAASGIWNFRIMTDRLTNFIAVHGQSLEALNHYTRRDGAIVTLRAVALTDRNEAGLVTSARLYTDTSPLFAPVARQL